jgi:hypothetical protein
VHHRHAEIHQYHIRPVLAEALDGLLAILGLGDYQDIRLAGDDVNKPGADDRVIIDH